MNYGYAVVRSAIARKLVATGFHPTFGIHHDSQLNAFNLAEPYRAIVDLVAHENVGSNIQLSKTERRELAHVLHNACIVDGVKINVMSAIDMMVESLKRIILENSVEKLIIFIWFQAKWIIRKNSWCECSYYDIIQLNTTDVI